MPPLTKFANKQPKPEKQSKPTNGYYAKLCVRALHVGLREAAKLELDDSQTVMFLKALEIEISAMRQKKDFADPFIDLAVQGALLRVAKQKELDAAAEVI